MRDVMTFLGDVAIVATIMGFLLMFFFGVSGFHVPRFLISRISEKRRPKLLDDVQPEVFEK